MGGKSSSSQQSTNTTQDFAFNNVDNRVANGAGIVEGNKNFNLANSTVSGGISVVSTDYNSVQQALGLASATNDSIENIATHALTTTDTLVNETLTRESILTANALDLLGRSFSSVAGQYQAESASTRETYLQTLDALGDSGRRATEAMVGINGEGGPNWILIGLVAVGLITIVGGVIAYKKKGKK